MYNLSSAIRLSNQSKADISITSLSLSVHSVLVSSSTIIGSLLGRVRSLPLLIVVPMKPTQDASASKQGK